MMKLKLEDLAVDTFATLPEAPLRRGTVHALADTDACYASADGACLHDSVDVCAVESRDCNTMVEPCHYFCGVTQPEFFTCSKFACQNTSMCEEPSMPL